jgi:hypothetical protein
MKKIMMLLPFVLLGCKPNASLVSKPIATTVNKPTEIRYKVKEKEVAATLKYLSSDELQGRETGTKGMEKAADYLEQFFKTNNVKPYFSSYRDTLSNFKGTAYNIVGYVEGTDPVLKKEFLLISG